MELKYHGTQWLKEGFVYSSLYDYIEKTKQELTKPLHAPEYAAAREEERLRSVSEKVQTNPYQSRAAFSELIKRETASYENVRPLSYRENMLLYDICVFAVKRMMNLNPIIFLYKANNVGKMYNAFASDYQDKVWIYISEQFFLEEQMLREEELCFLVGHELGHAQCHHIYISNVNRSSTSDDEYSADRAGLIACAEWIRRMHPEYTAEQAARLAVLYSATMLQKLSIGMQNGPGKTKWSEFDYGAMENSIQEVFDGASKLSVSEGTHPHTRHRIMAMILFSQSQLFYRCLKVDTAGMEGLYSDQQLNTVMSYQLVGS